MPIERGWHELMWYNKSMTMLGKQHTKFTRLKISKSKTKIQEVQVVCECGVSFSRKPDHGRSPRFCSSHCRYKYGGRLGRPLNKISREKMSTGMLGERNHRWRGGVSRERLKLRNTRAYRDWRKAVFTRDDYTCQKCRARGVVINADHIIPYFRQPELLLDVNNGQTLCVSCHHKKTQLEMKENWTNQYGSATLPIRL